MNRTAQSFLVVTPQKQCNRKPTNTEWERKTKAMATTEIPEFTNDLIDLTNERVDNLAALITVTAEQLDDRVAAGEALEAGAHRTAELIELVFGSSTPSVENYLAAHDQELQAA